MLLHFQVVFSIVNGSVWWGNFSWGNSDKLLRFISAVHLSSSHGKACAVIFLIFLKVCLMEKKWELFLNLFYALLHGIKENYLLLTKMRFPAQFVMYKYWRLFMHGNNLCWILPDVLQLSWKSKSIYLIKWITFLRNRTSLPNKRVSKA